MLSGRPGQGARPVVFYGPPSPLAAAVLEIAALADVDVTPVDVAEAAGGEAEPPNIPTGTALVLVAAGAQFHPEWADCPRVSVGEGESDAEIRLPHQAHHLVQVLTDPLLRSGTTGASPAAATGRHGARPGRVVIAAGAHGGAGATTAAQQLARAGRAIAVDASNHPPAGRRSDDELHWGLIDPGDPPLPADLLRGLKKNGGLRHLRTDVGDAVCLADPRLEVVLSVSPTTMVVDAGVWQPYVEKLAVGLLGRGLDPRLVLVSTDGPSHGLRVAGILGASSGVCFPELVLVAGRETGELRAVCAQWKVTLRRLPAGRQRRKDRSWEALWKAILEG